MEARKIIITGGATRIGAAIAKKLSGQNNEILIHYNRSKSKAEKLKKDLSKNGSIVGPPVETVKTGATSKLITSPFVKVNTF